MQLSAETIWSSAQEQLRGMLSADIFNLWFAPVRATAVENDLVVLEVPNDFCELWLKDNYQGLLQDVLSGAGAKQLRAKFVVAAGQTTLAAPANGKKAEPVPKSKPTSSNSQPQDRPAASAEWAFNPKNTFETFVVGNNNNFAFGAAKAVAEAPGKSYNPLFLYGGVGLGKTHLLHAIGQHVVSTKKGARVGYVSSEKFTNEYIDAIQNNSLAKFRKKYRQTDVLLIDDIQFLAGKERIQEEFFHTFNALREAHKQIVLTCDRPARDPGVGAPLGFAVRVGIGHRPSTAGCRDPSGHPQEESREHGRGIDGRDRGLSGASNPHEHSPFGRRPDPGRFLCIFDREKIKRGSCGEFAARNLARRRPLLGQH
jgi:chromosomal replication initiator protein